MVSHPATMKPLVFAFLVSSFAIPHSSFGAVRLPSIFTDHMVLQRDKAVPVWGKAAPGKRRPPKPTRAASGW